MGKILIVDDDEDLLFLIGEYLESCGIEFDTAASAAQARKRLNHSRYDLVISDFNMPGESGLDLFRSVSIRQPETPFILMTGNSDPRLRREAVAMGICDFMEKPFHFRELKRLLSSAAQRRIRSIASAPAA